MTCWNWMPRVVWYRCWRMTEPERIWIICPYF
jgi:hypothetical protein